MSTRNLSRPAPVEAAPAWRDEDERARTLASYELDPLEDDEELAQIVRFAGALCRAPICLISLVEEERQRFLAREGLAARETPRETSFCAHAMLLDEPMTVPDARDDERFAANPLVTGEPFIRFYFGQPLKSAEGIPLGALCIIDSKPRPEGLDSLQRQGMEVLANAVMRRLHQRRELLAALRDLEVREGQFRSLADSIPAIAWSADAEGNFEYFNKRMIEFTGDPDDKEGKAFHPEDWKTASKAWQHSLRTGEPYQVQHRLCRHDGQYRWMMARAVPVRDADGVIVRWFGTAVDIHDLYEASETRDLLAKELSHRIKNIFAVVTGLVQLLARKDAANREFADELNSAIRALGRAHDYVRPVDGAQRDNLHGLLEELFAAYGSGDGARVQISGDDLSINSRAATPLALVFHELATNAAKYGALSRSEGRVQLTVADKGEVLHMTWKEQGGPKPKASPQSGFGSRLVEMSVTGQLDGRLDRRFEPDGLAVEILVSKKAVAA